MIEVTIISTYPNRQPIGVSSRGELIEALQDSKGKNSCVYILRSSGKGELTCGISKSFGFVQYTTLDQSLPYLIAAKDKPRKDISTFTDFIEFDAGGSPTQIPKELCIPIEDVFRIAAEYFFDDKLSDDFFWVPI